MAGGVGNQASTQLDSLQAQYNMNEKIGSIVTEMKNLTNEVRAGNIDSKRLQEINLIVQDLQRDLEVAKQIQEALKKAMEKVNEMPR